MLHRLPGGSSGEGPPDVERKDRSCACPRPSESLNNFSGGKGGAHDKADGVHTTHGRGNFGGQWSNHGSSMRRASLGVGPGAVTECRGRRAGNKVVEQKLMRTSERGLINRVQRESHVDTGEHKGRLT